MNSTTYAFIYSGDVSVWKTSTADSWNLDLVELDGTEKVVGHRKIEGSICKVLQASDGKLLAITK